MCAGEGCSVFGPCFYYSVLSILFSFAVILREREREMVDCFTLIVILMSCHCQCSMALKLPFCVVG